MTLGEVAGPRPTWLKAATPNEYSLNLLITQTNHVRLHSHLLTRNKCSDSSMELLAILVNYDRQTDISLLIMVFFLS